MQFMLIYFYQRNELSTYVQHPSICFESFKNMYKGGNILISFFLLLCRFFAQKHEASGNALIFSVPQKKESVIHF